MVGPAPAPAHPAAGRRSRCRSCHEAVRDGSPYGDPPTALVAQHRGPQLSRVRRSEAVLAIAASSLLFAADHYLLASRDPFALAGYVGVGLAFGLVAWYSGRLGPTGPRPLQRHRRPQPAAVELSGRAGFSRLRLVVKHTLELSHQSARSAVALDQLPQLVEQDQGSFPVERRWLPMADHDGGASQDFALFATESPHRTVPYRTGVP